MKNIYKIISITLIFVLVFTACMKNNKTTKTNDEITTTVMVTTTESTTVETTTDTTTTTQTEPQPATTKEETTTEKEPVTTEPTIQESITVAVTTTPETTTEVLTTIKAMPTFEGPTTDELKAVELLNKEREKAGLHKLTFNYKLYNCAKQRATETITQLSHTRPDGSRFSTVLKDYGIPTKHCLGENICYNYDIVPTAIKVLMDSPTHKENILREKFNSVAIGIMPLGNGTYTMVQLFEG